MVPQGTRRLSAILFADMVDYSALSQHDESRALELARELQARLGSHLSSYHGRLVKTLGDGVLVEFESALEAAQCAVAVQENLHAANATRTGPRLEARIGIHVGDVVHEQNDVLGDTVNIAARIEPLAEPGGVAFSGTVFEQVAKKVAYPATLLEHAFLKNIDTPIAVYSLDLPWHSAPAARITPFTDRVREIDRLRQAVADAAQRHGAIVAVVGESGVGKTRLADETLRLAARRGFRTARARGFENVKTGPYAPWAEIARELLRDAPSPWLYRATDGCVREVAGLLPELADRLGPVPSGAELNPDRARLQFFAGLSRFLENVASDAPLALLLDDLQWADRETLAFLQYLAERITEVPVLTLLTCRDLELAPEDPLRRTMLDLRLKRRLTEVALNRMGPEETRSLVAAVLGGAPVAGGLAPAISEKTGGNPLFVEEVVRSLTDEEALVRTPGGWAVRPGVTVSVPPTVQEAVLRRVQRLGDDIVGVLEAASVLANEFEFDDLRELCEMDENRLLPLAEAALRARLMVEREIVPGRPVYRLADEQLQGVLYSTLSLVRRQRLHRRAAETLERRLAARASDRAVELAQHYLLGARPDKAAEFFCRAGDRAREVFAHEEAVEAYRRAAALVEEALVDPSQPSEWAKRGASVYDGLGEAHFALSQHDAAHASFLRGSMIVRSQDPVRGAYLLYCAGAARERCNDYPGARTELEEAGAILERLPDAERGDAWRTTWRQVQSALFFGMYWLADTAGREQVLERIQTVLGPGGRKEDLHEPYALRALHGWRRDRTVTDESFGFYRKALEFSADDRLVHGTTEVPLDEVFTFGFMLYWHGDFEQARAQLMTALERAERARSFTLVARATNYLLSVARRTGAVEDARRLVPALREASRQAELPEYEGFAIANDAWLKWKSGEYDGVEPLGRAALDLWTSIPERYPVDWMALWPMIALRLTRGDARGAVDLCQGLLASTQEPLPPMLRDLVHEAVEASDTGRTAKVTDALGRAVEKAKQAGFL